MSRLYFLLSMSRLYFLMAIVSGRLPTTSVSILDDFAEQVTVC
jgi:hypothetical protein